MIMLTDIVEKIGMYEKTGFTRDQAIQVVQAEQLLVMNNRLFNMLNKLGSPNIDASKKD